MSPDSAEGADTNLTPSAQMLVAGGAQVPANQTDSAVPSTANGTEKGREAQANQAHVFRLEKGIEPGKAGERADLTPVADSSAAESIAKTSGNVSQDRFGAGNASERAACAAGSKKPRHSHASGDTALTSAAILAGTVPSASAPMPEPQTGTGAAAATADAIARPITPLAATGAGGLTGAGLKESKSLHSATHAIAKQDSATPNAIAEGDAPAPAAEALGAAVVPWKELSSAAQAAFANSSIGSSVGRIAAAADGPAPGTPASSHPQPSAPDTGSLPPGQPPTRDAATASLAVAGANKASAADRAGAGEGSGVPVLRAAGQRPRAVLSGQVPTSIAEAGSGRVSTGWNGPTSVPRAAETGRPGSRDDHFQRSFLVGDVAHTSVVGDAGGAAIEVGFHDTTLGWLSVRASTADEGRLHLSIAGRGQYASSAISGMLPSLDRFLHEHNLPVQTLTSGGTMSSTGSPAAVRVSTGDGGLPSNFSGNVGDSAAGRQQPGRDARRASPSKVSDVSTEAAKVVSTARLPSIPQQEPGRSLSVRI